MKKSFGLIGLFLLTAVALVGWQLKLSGVFSGIYISPSKKLFTPRASKTEMLSKLKAGLEVILTSNSTEVPENKIVEISASLIPALDYQNVTLEWRLGPGVRLIDGVLKETIPTLIHGKFAIKKIRVVFLDQNENRQIHIVARFKENGKILGSVAQFNSRPDLIEASKLEAPPPPAQTEDASKKVKKGLFKDSPAEARPIKIMM